MPVYIHPQFNAQDASTNIPLPGSSRDHRNHEITLSIVDASGTPASAVGVLSGSVRYIGMDDFIAFTETIDVAVDNLQWNPFLASIADLRIDSTILTGDRFLVVTVNSWEG